MQSSTQKLTDVRGIGEATQGVLVGIGIDSVEALATATPEKLSTCPGFGPARIQAVQRAARALLESSPKIEKPKPPPKSTPRIPQKEAVESQGSKSKPPKSTKEKPKMAKKSKKDKKVDKKKKKVDKKKKGDKKKKKGKKGKKK